MRSVQISEFLPALIQFLGFNVPSAAQNGQRCFNLNHTLDNLHWGGGGGRRTKRPLAKCQDLRTVVKV